MTCIVGTKVKGGVLLGADSIGVAGYSYSVRKDPKVGRTGPYVFGYVGSFRFGQVLLYDFKPPEPKRRSAPELYRFLVSDFIPALREVMNKAGIIKVEHTIEEFNDAGIVLGLHNHLFGIGCDLQVEWPTQPFLADGCGHAIANGAMYVAHKNKKKGKDLLLAGLEAAEEFSCAVKSPFIFEGNY